MSKKIIKLSILVTVIIVCIVSIMNYINHRGKVYDCGLTEAQIESKQAVTAEETIRQYIYWSNQRHPSSKEFVSDDINGSIQEIVSFALGHDDSFLEQVIVNPTVIVPIGDAVGNVQGYYVEMEVQPYILKTQTKERWALFLHIKALDNGNKFQIQEIATGP